MRFFPFLTPDNSGSPTSLDALQHNVHACEHLLQLGFREFLHVLSSTPQCQHFLDTFLKGRRRPHEASQSTPVRPRGFAYLC